MNPRSTRMKVAMRIVSDISEKHKWHGKEIPDGWLRVEVSDVLYPNTPLMVENTDADQEKLADVVGGNVIWDQKYVKVIPCGSI